MLRTFSQQIFSDIANRIAKGELKAGQKLVLREIQEHYGVSSTPARDALALLNQFGYVEMNSHTAAKVVAADEKMKQDLIQVDTFSAHMIVGISLMNNREGVLQALKYNYEKQLRWDNLELSERASLHSEFLNIFLDYSNNDILKSLFDKTTGKIAAVFGTYTGKFGTEETRKDCADVISAIEDYRTEDVVAIISRQMKYLE